MAFLKNYPSTCISNRNTYTKPCFVTGKGIVCALDGCEVLIMLESGRLIWAKFSVLSVTNPEIRTLINYSYLSHEPEQIWCH